MKKLFENLSLGIFAYIPVVLFFILNALGGIIGGVWLIIVGDWEIVVGSIIAAVIYPFIYSIIAMIFQFPLITFGGYLLKKGWKIIGYPVLYISILIIDVVALTWIFTSFNMVLTAGESTNIIPFLLVAYTLAVSPFVYMAKGESPDSTATNITLSFIFVSSIIYGISWIFYSKPVVSIACLILIIILMLLKQIYQFYQLFIEQKLSAQLNNLTQN